MIITRDMILELRLSGKKAEASRLLDIYYKQKAEEKRQALLSNRREYQKKKR